MKPGQLRRAMAAGIALVVLFVVGVILNFTNTPETKSSETSAAVAQKWVSYLSSSSHRTSLLVSGYLLTLAGLAFVWFTIGLRAWLAPDAAGGRLISNLGVLGAGAMAAAAMAGTAVAGAVAFGNEAVPQSGDAIRIVMGTAYPFLVVVFGLTSALLIATVAVTATRSGALPRWLAYAGWLAVLGCLAGVFGPPFLLVVVWYLVLSIGQLRLGFTAQAEGEIQYDFRFHECRSLRRGHRHSCKGRGRALTRKNTDTSAVRRVSRREPTLRRRARTSSQAGI